MKRFSLQTVRKPFFLACAIFVSVSAHGDPGFLTFSDRRGLLDPNPASIGYIERAYAAAAFRTGAGFGELHDVGVSLNAPGLGFTILGTESAHGSLTELRFRSGVAGRLFSAGIDYGLYRGSGRASYGHTLTSGLIVRGNNYASAGFSGTVSLTGDGMEGVAGLSIRPLGNPLLELRGNYAVDTGHVDLLDGDWDIAAQVEPLPGIRFSGGYNPGRGASAGIQFSTGAIGTGYTVENLEGGDAGRGIENIWSLRAGGYDRNVFDTILARPTRFLELDLSGFVTERGASLFDTSPHMRELVQAVEEAAVDPTVGGIVLDATNTTLGQTQAFELYEHLQRFRSAGKQLVVFLENASMDTLYLIAAADHVVMDPYGGMFMPGFFAQTTYLVDLLDGAGIGAEEFRYEAYKSGFESFVRSDMSSAEREQRRDYVDHAFDTLSNTITGSERISEQEFLELIDYAPPVSARMLMESGLVDRTGRYPDIDEILEDYTGSPVARTDPSRLVTRLTPDDAQWEAPARIGVVFAFGEVLSDGGMNTRALAREIRSMRDDESIEAIVLRVNSPGGTILASQMLAAEVRAAAEVKPVTVSMGGIAASGGYWIAMYADTIFAEPLTLTGSIGIIGGWFSDEGISDRLLLETDGVQRGRSADLFGGAVLPLVGLQLPGRGLTEQERTEFLDQSEELYDDFVSRVAEARDLDPADAGAVAEGRIWTGPQAFERGLVDNIGTFTDAFEYTVREAGIRPGRRIELVTAPELPFFALPGAFSSLLASGGSRAETAIPTVSYLELMLEMNGHPTALVPFEVVQWYTQTKRTESPDDWRGYE
ncbi:MAG: S49 family peptidase [Spirochaetaceae bacterium]